MMTSLMSLQTRASHFRRVLMTIKACRGDVYGQCVRDMLQYDAVASQSDPNVMRLPFESHRTFMRQIRCRLNDRTLLNTLLMVLRVDYCVTFAPSVTLDVRDDETMVDDLVYNISFGHEPEQIQVTLHVCTMFRNMWRLQRPAFDVDMLASSGTSIYVYTSPSMYSPADQVGTVLSRVFAKRFAPVNPDATAKSMAMAVVAAADMVLDGWTMDNTVLGGRHQQHWAVCQWKDVIPRYGAQRVKGDECSICQERFRHADVVLLLPCSHAFHCHCSGKRDSSDGICRWIQLNDSCPCCRKNISSFHINP